MYTEAHDMPALFAQLGLPNSDTAIQSFLHNHQLHGKETIENAAFWTGSQATFIREAIQNDADWAEIVDELDARLRHH